MKEQGRKLEADWVTAGVKESEPVTWTRVLALEMR